MRRVENQTTSVSATLREVGLLSLAYSLKSSFRRRIDACSRHEVL